MSLNLSKNAAQNFKQKDDEGQEVKDVLMTERVHIVESLET